MPDVSTAQKDRLMNDLRVVIADAEELMRTTASEVGEGAAAATGIGLVVGLLIGRR